MKFRKVLAKSTVNNARVGCHKVDFRDFFYRHFELTENFSAIFAHKLGFKIATHLHFVSIHTNYN